MIELPDLIFTDLKHSHNIKLAYPIVQHRAAIPNKVLVRWTKTGIPFICSHACSYADVYIFQFMIK